MEATHPSTTHEGSLSGKAWARRVRSIEAALMCRPESLSSSGNTTVDTCGQNFPKASLDCRVLETGIAVSKKAGDGERPQASCQGSSVRFTRFTFQKVSTLHSPNSMPS